MMFFSDTKGVKQIIDNIVDDNQVIAAINKIQNTVAPKSSSPADKDLSINAVRNAIAKNIIDIAGNIKTNYKYNKEDEKHLVELIANKIKLALIAPEQSNTFIPRFNMLCKKLTPQKAIEKSFEILAADIYNDHSDVTKYVSEYKKAAQKLSEFVDNIFCGNLEYQAKKNRLDSIIDEADLHYQQIIALKKDLNEIEQQPFSDYIRRTGITGLDCQQRILPKINQAEELLGRIKETFTSSQFSSIKTNSGLSGLSTFEPQFHLIKQKVEKQRERIENIKDDIQRLSPANATRRSTAPNVSSRGLLTIAEENENDDQHVRQQSRRKSVFK